MKNNKTILFTSRDNTNYTIGDFYPIVTSIASKKCKDSSLMNFDDLCQELWIKLFSKKDRLTEYSDEHVFGMVKQMLSNHAVDIFRAYTRKEGKEVSLEPASSGDEDKMSLGEMIRDTADMSGENSLFDSECENSAEEEIQGHLIKGLVLRWLETQDSETRMFIKEMMDPSEKMWAATPERFQDRESPLPSVVSKELNISITKYWNARCALQKYLHQNGCRVVLAKKYYNDRGELVSAKM